MGSQLLPLLANKFMCSIEENLEKDNKLPYSVRRSYVDDTLAAVQDILTAATFIATLDKAHPSINFTMELVINNNWFSSEWNSWRWVFKLEHASTGKQQTKDHEGLLLHYQNHADNRYINDLFSLLCSIVHIDSHLHLMYSLLKVITWKRSFSS